MKNGTLYANPALDARLAEIVAEMDELEAKMDELGAKDMVELDAKEDARIAEARGPEIVRLMEPLKASLAAKNAKRDPGARD